MASENAPSAKPDQPSLSLILLKAIVDEIHKAAHDPATVHLVADKLKRLHRSIGKGVDP